MLSAVFINKWVLRALKEAAMVEAAQIKMIWQEEDKDNDEVRASSSRPQRAHCSTLSLTRRRPAAMTFRGRADDGVVPLTCPANPHLALAETR